MDSLNSLLAWWNLVFAIPVALSILLIVVSAVGGLEGGSDAESHADIDGHAHVDVDTHTDIEGHAHFDMDGHANVDGHADIDGHVHADVDGHGDGSDHETHGHALGAALEWVGVGIVPVSLLAQGFLLFFGIVGLTVNRILNVAAHPDILIWASLAVASLGGIGSAGVFGALGRRFLPGPVTSIGKRDLVGRTGRVVFPVSVTSGTVQVRDATGALHQVAARLSAAGETLTGGSEILVTGYDGETDTFLVDESPFTLTSDELRRAR